MRNTDPNVNQNSLPCKDCNDNPRRTRVTHDQNGPRSTCRTRTPLYCWECGAARAKALEPKHQAKLEAAKAESRARRARLS